MGCFGGQEIPIPPYQEPPVMPEFEMPEMSMEFPEFPEPYDVEGAETRRKRAEEVSKTKEIEMRRKGFRSTLLTGGTGDETVPALKRPSLLGS